MRAQILLGCVSAMAMLCGCAQHRVAKAVTPGISAAAPVVVAEEVREAVPDDYLRVSFLAPGTKVTSIARPGALRGFMTATVLYSPPLTVEEYPKYSGLVNDDSKALVAMRCKPADPAKVDAVLATWPNVFAAVLRDVPLDPGECDGTPSDPGKQAACYAKGFSDTAEMTVPTALALTFSYAGTIYDGNHEALARWLQSNYGIYPAFAGTGYSVKDSYSIEKQPMTPDHILVKSVSSEYLLKNVSLSDGNCRCISVEPYPERFSSRLDPEFIEQQGGDGLCKDVKRLPR
ncbi:MAG: hypothetical protein JOZ33_00145 [Acidobacteriaceae bacterium]|nr:hypothetical protein [Acidobacteriaceae bacterium]